jgi:hypothetical protein
MIETHSLLAISCLPDKLLLVIASTMVLGSESHDHILSFDGFGSLQTLPNSS